MNASYQDRVLSEDALKHVFQCEYDRLVASADSMAGALRLTRDAARLLVDRLGAAGLVTTEGGAVHLTVSGREYALQILRAHRLYETFLARETGLGSGEWHLRAEVDEHKLTPAHVDALAQRLGNPRYDPHGDPIPTSTGELPPARGRALSEWPPGVEARIVHVEDEPASIDARHADCGGWRERGRGVGAERGAVAGVAADGGGQCVGDGIGPGADGGGSDAAVGGSEAG
jgi:DtxR family Mn-dependent transcriptional regulator